MTLELRYQQYRLFPYERALARRELDALGLEIVHDGAAAIIARGAASSADLSRLTYFQAVHRGDNVLVPDLAQIERRHLDRRVLSRSRQVTRYLVHGLHEYKGKFHPQLVRAFANLLGVERGDLVIDPFCGSGTTLVEAALLGADSVGLDLSPVAVAITRAKLAVLSSPDGELLATRLDEWRDDVMPSVNAAYTSGTTKRSVQLDADAERYLRKWFNPRAFGALAEALAGLATLSRDDGVHAVASVALSSILRESSEQAPEDLRIRRRAPSRPASPLPGLLQAALTRASDAVRETAEAASAFGASSVVLGDLTHSGTLSGLRASARRAVVITSPPYATALPYVDTDRLSIVALGLATPATLRPLEAELIGSREWLGSEDRRWSLARETNANNLPEAVVELCATIRAAEDGAGFRRRAVPGLLYRYFSLMGEAFAEMRAALLPGEKAVLVVGVNRTGRGVDEIIIDTPTLLGQIAQQHGFEVTELLPLETWPRYGLHQENGVRGESAVMVTAV